MSLNFSDVKNVIDYNNNTDRNKGYAYPLLPRFNSVIGNLQQEQVHVISGLPSSGVTSFIDQNYVISVLLQMYLTKPEDRQPIKIFYYSMKDSEMKKLQLLLCNYIKLVNNLTVNLDTLNNQVGKLYDLNKFSSIKGAIEKASDFFDEILDEEILVIKDGQKRPTEIYNDLVEYANEIGTLSPTNKFQYDDDHDEQITLVVVDPVDNLIPDNEGFGLVTGHALDEKFQRDIKTLRSTYKFSFAIAVPSITGYIRSPKDTEPHFRHLGSYGSVADKGICLYNPINENNVKFYDGDEEPYIGSKGDVLLRTWHVVRNTSGIESVNDRLLFLPGTSYLVEHSFKLEIVNELKDVIKVLNDQSDFFQEEEEDEDDNDE